MRVRLVRAVPYRRFRGPVEFASHVFEFKPFNFERLFRSCAGGQIEVDHGELDKFVASAHEADAIFCETPEAMVLAHEWARRHMTPRALLALDVHGLVRVRAVRNWYLASLGLDPWPEAVAAPWISWIAASSTQHEQLIRALLPPERVYLINGSTFLFSLLLPDAEKRLDGGQGADGKGTRSFPRDMVLVPGSGRRDLTTALQAATILADLPFVIVSERQKPAPGSTDDSLPSLPSNLQWLGPVPLEDYIALVRRARMVVVPLMPGTGDGGHVTVALAHRLRVPVICSDASGIADYFEPGLTGLRVACQDPEDLARVISRLWQDAGLRGKLAEVGGRVEQQRVEACRDGFFRALSAACSGLPRGREDR